MKKMTFALVMLVTSVLVSACGSDNGTADSSNGSGGANGAYAYGTWDAGEVAKVGDGENQISLRMEIRISSNSVTSIAHCVYTDGFALRAEVTGDARVTSNSIESLESKERVTTSGSRTCRASLDKGFMNYTLNGNQLTLSKDGQSINLVRK